jgi:hypothetical protein
LMIRRMRMFVCIAPYQSSVLAIKAWSLCSKRIKTKINKSI